MLRFVYLGTHAGPARDIAVFLEVTFSGFETTTIRNILIQPQL